MHCPSNNALLSFFTNKDYDQKCPKSYQNMPNDTKTKTLENPLLLTDF